MCDSVEILFKLNRVDRHRQDTLKLLYRVHVGRWEGDEWADQAWLPAIDANSPLTGAGFKIQPVGFLDPDAREVGYIVKASIPACTVGNNYLLENSVIASARIALRLLHYWMSSQGCSARKLACFTIENSENISLSPTFFVEAGNWPEALRLLRDFGLQAEAVNNVGLGQKNQSLRPAYASGPSETATRYIRLTGHKVSAYVKEPAGKKAFAKFPSKEVQQKLLTAAAAVLRVDVKLSRRWLRKHKLWSPMAWVRNGTDNPYARSYSLILKALGANKRVQTRMPSASQLAKLTSDYRAVFEFYRAGNDPRTHSIFTERPTVKAANIKFSRYRNRIRDVTGFDIDIPVQTHVAKVSVPLCKAMQTRRINPPAELSPLIFSQQTAEAAVAKLDELIQEFTANPRANIDWGPAKTAADTPAPSAETPKRRYARGIGSIDVPEGSCDEIIEIDGERLLV